MIDSRRRGLLTLQAVVVLIFMPLWFSFNVLMAVEVFQRMNYAQVNFPLYIFGIAAASLISLNYNYQTIPHGTERYRWVSAVKRTNADIIVLTLIFFSIVFATKDKTISRLFLGFHLTSTWCMLLFFNRYLPGWLSSIAFRGRNTINTLLVGSPRAARRLEDWILTRPPLGMKVIGMVCYDEDEQEDVPLPIIGYISDFDNILSENEIYQVILLETRKSKAWVNYVVDTCFREGCRVLILNNWEEYIDQPLTAVTEGNHTFFTLQAEPLENPLNRLVKRTTYVCVSLPIVLFILPPLCLLVKLMQWKQAPGPLFFRQKRTGHQKREFTILKFRTMRPPSESKPPFEAKQASIEDERIFAFGQFLRRKSLDEFPQFINVLLGNMSVVGPRPHLSAHDEHFKRLVEIYRTRHFVKPGITGLAQCRGFRGEITDVDQIRERVRLDLEYINNWSIWLDLGLIVRTFNQIFFPPKSAY